MARQVIVSPFLQRRSLLFQAGENAAQGITRVGDDVAQAIFAYQQEKEREKQTKIHALEQVAKQFGGFSKLSPEDVSEYERLTQVKFPRDPADPSRVAKTRSEQMLEMLGPPTHEQAQVEAGYMQPAPNPAMTQAKIDAEANKRATHLADKEQEWNMMLARESRADQRVLMGKRLANDQDYRKRPSGYGMDAQGKIKPWKQLEGKPDVRQMDEGEYHYASQSRHYRMLDRKTQQYFGLGLDKVAMDAKTSAYIRSLLAQAKQFDAAGQKDASKLVYSSAVSAGMKAQGATDEQIQKALSDPGLLKQAIDFMQNMVGNESTPGMENKPTKAPVVTPTDQTDDVDSILRKHGY